MIAALLGITTATVEKRYAFFDRELAVARGQKGLEKVNQALAGVSRKGGRK